MTLLNLNHFHSIPKILPSIPNHPLHFRILLPNLNSLSRKFNQRIHRVQINRRSILNIIIQVLIKSQNIQHSIFPSSRANLSNSEPFCKHYTTFSHARCVNSRTNGCKQLLLHTGHFSSTVLPNTMCK